MRRVVHCLNGQGHRMVLGFGLALGSTRISSNDKRPSHHPALKTVWSAAREENP